MIGVIADDLTGAAELGAVGLRHRLRSQVLLSGNPDAAAELVCIDTHSRSCAPQEAGQRSAAGARVLTSNGAKWIYKKVDSVLRGQIAHELQAVLTELRMNRALLVPTNPSRGRTIQNGCYFIQGKPIHETEFALDPEYPRTSPRVIDLLSAPPSINVTVCSPLGPFPDTGIIVPEVVSSDDLRALAARQWNNTLLAGAAEFFGALLVQTGHAPTVPASRAPAPEAREIFVCGSISESSRQFVRKSREHGTPIFSLPESAARLDFDATFLDPIAKQAASALNKIPRIILNIGLPLIADKTISKSLSTHLAHLAQSVLQRIATPTAVPNSRLPTRNSTHFYVEGGATATELVQRMDWQRLAVVEEIAPGTATLSVEADRHLLLTIKPGSYPWPDQVNP